MTFGRRGRLVAVLAIPILVVLLVGDATPQSRTKIRYALGDVVSIDDLPLLIAVERAKARGVDVEITAFKSEEIATQAVINGQADVGQGTPYAALEKVNVPIRFFHQLMTLQFFPIVSKEHYKSVSYVPGSQVRALALLKGTIKATILDAPNKSYVMKEAADRFVILPLGELKASDEALFAPTAFLEKNQAAVAVLVEELIRVARAINANPGFAVEERKRLGLLKDLPPKMEAEVLPFYEEAVQGGIFPGDGGGERAARNDLEFFKLAGQIKGESPKVDDFWHFGALKAALSKVGG